MITGAGTGKKTHTYKTERDKDNMEAQGRKTMSYFSTVFQITGKDTILEEVMFFLWEFICCSNASGSWR